MRATMVNSPGLITRAPESLTLVCTVYVYSNSRHGDAGRRGFRIRASTQCVFKSRRGVVLISECLSIQTVRGTTSKRNSVFHFPSSKLFSLKTRTNFLLVREETHPGSRRRVHEKYEYKYILVVHDCRFHLIHNFLGNDESRGLI